MRDIFQVIDLTKLYAPTIVTTTMAREKAGSSTGKDTSTQPQLPSWVTDPGSITRAATEEALRRGLAGRDTGTARDPLGRKQNGGPSTKSNG